MGKLPRRGEGGFSSRGLGQRDRSGPLAIQRRAISNGCHVFHTLKKRKSLRRSELCTNTAAPPPTTVTLKLYFFAHSFNAAEVAGYAYSSKREWRREARSDNSESVLSLSFCRVSSLPEDGAVFRKSMHKINISQANQSWSFQQSEKCASKRCRPALPDHSPTIHQDCHRDLNYKSAVDSFTS